MATTTKYLPSEMAAAIDAIPIFSNITVEDNGMVVVNGHLVDQTSRNIVANGTYDTTSNNEVIVNVGVSGAVTLSDKTITANGTYDPARDNVDGYSRVTVNVPTEASSLTQKTITENGTYYPTADGYDGYSVIIVNVGGGFSHADVQGEYNIRAIEWQSEVTSSV